MASSVAASLHPHEGPAPKINQKLLRALVAEGSITQGDAEQAELYAKRRRMHVEEALIEIGVVDEAQLLKLLAAYYKTYFVSTKKLASAPINESLLKLITHKLAAKLCVFPVKYEQRTGELSILCVEPDDPDTLKSVQFGTRVGRVKALVARPAAIQAAIRHHFLNEPGAFGSVRSGGVGVGDRSGTMNEERPRRNTQNYDQTSLAPPPDMTLEIERRRPSTVEIVTGARPVPPPPPPPPPPQAAPLAFAPPPTYPTAAQNVATAATVMAMPGLQAFNAPVATQMPAMPMMPAVPAMQMPAPMSAPAFDPGPSPTMATGEHQIESPNASIAMHDYLETLNVLVALLEQERGDLRGHSMTVARVTRRMCERLGLGAEESDAIIAAAYLHDIGKSSAHHLTALNVAQYEAHRQQAKKSYLTPVRIFEAVRLPKDVTHILTHLYERSDGQGFPDRLSGKEIPLGARVLAITETYADLTGHAGNAFRKRLSPQEAWDVLAKCKGKLFDPNLVDVLKLVVLGDDLRAKLLADRRRALIVDPDAEETTVLELRLAEHGYEVTIARTSSEAENELSSEFDVVISEVELKPQDGFSLLQKIRSNGVEIPFIFLTAKDDSDVVQRGFELGADDVITKPASPDVVALKVNRVLDGARRKKRPAGVSGSLKEMGLPDVVQILYHGRKSGKLAITAGGKRGEIHFSEGQIFDATFGSVLRDDAFYEMLSLADGEFELDPNFRPTERKIELSPESLLLEGMRRLDEAGR
jgi:putative nucleotidyltransferase with HDIG domain